jgi:hypothetical protein
MNDRSSRHRWFRFSLGGLFVVVTMVCVWLARNVHQVDQRDFVLEAIEARGGSIRHVEFFRGPGLSPKPMPRKSGAPSAARQPDASSSSSEAGPKSMRLSVPSESRT